MSYHWQAMTCCSSAQVRDDWGIQSPTMETMSECVAVAALGAAGTNLYLSSDAQVAESVTIQAAPEERIISRHISCK